MMHLAFDSTCRPQGVDLRVAAFESAIEPALLLDPFGDQILDAIPPPAPCSATTAHCCARPRPSALHAGQLPALIVFTQAVLDKGAYWTKALTPRHATGQTLRLEYAGCPSCRMTAARWCNSP